MSNIDFQNGFVCGMATKGLVRSGQLYQPLVWNDSGVYSYFYIDFRRAMESFSTGMFNESIIVHDSEQLSVTGVTYVSTGVYKIQCDISGRNHGIAVVNKKTSLLAFATKEQLPVFSVHFYVAGIDAYERFKYLYDDADFPDLAASITENASAALTSWITEDTISESEDFTNRFASATVTEAVSITLT